MIYPIDERYDIVRVRSHRKRVNSKSSRQRDRAHASTPLAPGWYIVVRPVRHNAPYGNELKYVGPFAHAYDAGSAISAVLHRFEWHA